MLNTAQGLPECAGCSSLHAAACTHPERLKREQFEDGFVFYSRVLVDMGLNCVFFLHSPILSVVGADCAALTFPSDRVVVLNSSHRHACLSLYS